jgi:ATP-dependent HslUV protease ATP-binding subunit HslU
MDSITTSDDSTDTLTPARIVAALDRHIVGQDDAKRAVAVAMRNRWRRRRLPDEVAREVVPRNIVMLGPTGVGKTEIARRLATLLRAPFIKVEATKFTEVGYVGRDVESMIRDLLEVAIRMTRQEQAEAVRERAERAAKDRLVSILLGEDSKEDRNEGSVEPVDTPPADAPHEKVRARLREKLDAGLFDDQEVEITVREKANIPAMGLGPEQNDPTMGGIGSMLESMLPSRTHRRKVPTQRALELLIEEETEPLIDQERAIEAAIERTELDGIVFIDEIDKVATSNDRGGDVSRQGVQRDLLPIVEGSNVTTRHGVVRTDGILFIAAGAFHQAAISDLMPELQGRFPIRVELSGLGPDDFRRILVEPEANLVMQQKMLLGTEGIEVEVSDDAIDAMAELAAAANDRMENIGARRLMTVIERVFEEVSFDAAERVARGEEKLAVDARFVRERVEPLLSDEDLGRFVL